MKSDSDLLYWLALNHIEEVGPVSYVKLVDHFGSPKNVFKASREEFQAIPGIRSKIVESILRFDDLNLIEKEIKALESYQIGLLFYSDPFYPQKLKQISSFPPILYVKGKIKALQKEPLLGVVGSRQVSEYGVIACKKIVRDLVKNGIGIVSGFARGIDITAHLVAVEESQATIAVLAGGFNTIHPPSHYRYIEQVMQKGALVSEFSFFKPPVPNLFPRRNRIISGLSRGVLVVEAGLNSGALITAEYALDQNRDLFAIPGPIFSQQSEGTNLLIQKGAQLVTSAGDILKTWKHDFCSMPEPTVFLNPDENKIFSACQHQAKTPDELVDETGLPTAHIFMLLSKLELEGKIKGLPGKRFQSL